MAGGVLSYIIAFVRFSGSSKVYCVDCNRTDVKFGDEVVIRNYADNAKFKRATIMALEYLNWNCKNYVACLVSETSSSPDGMVLPSRSLAHKGVCRDIDVYSYLTSKRWRQHRTVSRMFRSGFSYRNQSQFSNILFRSNGIDLQIVNDTVNGAIQSDGRLGLRLFLDNSNIVRHALSRSKINLYELIVEFSDEFQKNTGDYAKYMIPQGRSDKRTDRLKQKTNRSNDIGENLYEIFGGDGEPVYLGDGLYLTSDGRWSDG